MDEYLPGNYRQPLVSFHAKLPNAIPVGDAISLTNSVFLYSQQMHSFATAAKSYHQQLNTAAVSDADLSERSLKILRQQKPDYQNFSGIINMVSKHNNGTLNLWRLQFQENSQYQSLINITHLSRISGHRYKVGDISSHPILPFLLTNSIHDPHTNDLSGQKQAKRNSTFNYADKSYNFDLNLVYNQNVEPLHANAKSKRIQKGIIIWGVEPVGPLSITGGIYELARVDSFKENAFENIAWFPCFLPSFTLGNSSSSPSTLFISTDSSGITIYQAVFDARTLLHDIKHQHEKKKKNSTLDTLALFLFRQ